MKIEIKSVTFKATVEGKEIERTFTPDEKGMPGIFREIFNSIRFYLLHNPNGGQRHSERSEESRP